MSACWSACRQGWWAEVARGLDRLARYEAEASLANLPNTIQVARSAASTSQSEHLPPIADLTGFGSAPLCPHPMAAGSQPPCPSIRRGYSTSCRTTAAMNGKRCFAEIQKDFVTIHSHFGSNKRVDTDKQPRPPRWVETPDGEAQFRHKVEHELRAFCLKCLPDGAPASVQLVPPHQCRDLQWSARLRCHMPDRCRA